MVASLIKLCTDQNNKCLYCAVVFNSGGKGAVPTREHKKPRWAGGGSSRLNLIASCYSCNALKGPLDHHTFLAVMTDLGAIKRWQAAYTSIMQRTMAAGEVCTLENIHKQAKAKVGRILIKPGRGWLGGNRKAMAMGYPKEMTFEEAMVIVRLVEPDAGCDVDDQEDYERKYRRRTGDGNGKSEKIQAAQLRQAERMARIEFNRRMIDGVVVDFANPEAPFLQREK